MERFPQQITETSMKDMKEIILRMVNAHQGIKGVDLALKVMSEISPVIFVLQDYWTALTELLESDEVIEFEYALLDTPIRSIYFPKGTTLGTPNVKSEGRILQWRDAEASSV